MQTTLLGIAIAVILALVTALVGPLFINWNDHRALFEAEASRLIGLPVRVAGAIDASILPTPSVTLRGIAIGQPGEEVRLRAAELGFILGLGPLLRGELRAVELRLFAPEVRLGLNRAGGLDWPGLAIGFDREKLSIERLTIVEGRAILTDAASGARLVFDKLSFKGEVRSLIGPLRGEGAFAVADGRYDYRISTSRLDEDGLKFKLSVDASAQPLTIEADGALAFDQGAPRFKGNLALARPAGSVLASGKAAINEPWRVTGKVTAKSAAALFEQVEFQYGPEERAVKLNGAAEIAFGAQPRLQGTLSARHVDLDRLIAGPNAMRRLPFAAVKIFADMFGGLLRPALPTQISINIDAVTLGGATLQAVGGDLRTQGEGWQFAKLEFRAPGFTQVSASGRLDPIDKNFGFAGHVRINASDSMTLLTWLTGHSSPMSGSIHAWQARGDVMLSADRIAVERLQADFARAPLEGRIAYHWPSGVRPARLEASLAAAEFDLDAMLQFAAAAFAGVELQRPGELALALELGRARILGLEARKATVRLNLDGSGFDLQRLSVEDFGGAALQASGRIETQSSLPRGNIALDLDARDLGGVIALAEKFAPSAAEPLRRLARGHPAAKLHATLSMADATAKLGIAGHIGAVRVNVAAGATGDSGAFSFADLGALAATDVRIEGQLDSDDGAALLALIGLDRIAAADKQPGRITFAAAGPLNRDIRIDGKIAAAPIEANGQGTVHFFGDQPVTAKFDQFAGTISGSKVQGQLALTFGAPMRLDGRIDVDWLDAPAVLATIIGVPTRHTARNDASAWSLEPFAPSPSHLVGRIEFTAARAGFTPKLAVQPLRGVLRSEAAQIAFEELEGGLAGGEFKGQLAFASSSAGLSARAEIALGGADAAALIPFEKRSPVTGRLALQATFKGAGLSPAAFVGSLHGDGMIAIEGARVAGLNPQVFDELIRAVDLGIRTDAKQIREFVATLLDQGYLSVTRANATIAIAAGQARVIESHVQAKSADLAVAANLDLNKATIDAMVTLSGLPIISTAGRPTISVALKGPLTAPKSMINTDSLSGWLALRAVEQQSERLDAIEAARRAPTVQLPATLPALIALPARPTTRLMEKNASSPLKQTTVETTGAVSGADQAPPLPPPITIPPGKKRPEGRRAPPRGENAQSP